MNETALYALIQADATAAAAYAAGNDDACAARCSAIAPVIRQPVPAIKVQQAATLNGMWGTLGIAAADTTLTNPPRGAARAFIDWITSGWPMDVDREQVQTMAAQLVSFELVTVAQINEIKALADTPQTITAAQVGAAREWHRVTGAATNGTA